MKRAILESLNLIKYSVSREVQSVVIKPNLCYYWDYTTGQTTDPKFIASLIDVIHERTRNAKITIVESDASAMKCEYSFRMMGYQKLARDRKIRLVNLSREACEVVEVKVGKQSLKLLVPKIFQQTDLKINVPKIKYTMEPIKITCALKNVYGCNAYPQKFKYHPRLEEAIIAANKAMQFDLCIIDGNIVSGIQPRRVGLVMASQDAVAIDAAAARIAGLNPKTIGYIRLAHDEGLGKSNFIPVGASLNSFRDQYPKKDFKKKLMGRAYAVATRIGLSKRLGME